MAHLSTVELLALGLMFGWSSFVRTGIGFGGAALALPLMLIVLPEPIVLIPIIATHFLLFTSSILWRERQRVDWAWLRASFWTSAIPTLIGIIGLISLSGNILSLIVYAITLCYGLSYALNLSFAHGNRYTDAGLLMLGGYVSGTSMTGAPLLAAVYARHVSPSRLRNTLYVSFTWVVLLKMATFYYSGVDWQLRYAVLFLPPALIGHWLGLRFHERISGDDNQAFRRLIGVVLVVVTLLGFGLLITDWR